MACEREKDRIWEGARLLEDFAHAQRHRFLNVLTLIRSVVSPEQRAVLGLDTEEPPRVPSLNSLINPTN